jgi:hypothetical protein
MDKERKMIVAGVVLVALLAAVYLTRKEAGKAEQQHSATAAKDLPAIKIDKTAADKITRFVIKAKDKDEVTLEKKDKLWELTKPLSAKASQENVDSLLKSFEKLEVGAVIAEAPDDATVKRYELDDAKATHLQAFAGDKKILDAVFGKGGGRGQMMRLEGKGPIYAVQGYSSYQVVRDLKGWRDTDILKFEDGNVISVEVENKKGKLSFTKSDEKWAGASYPRDDKGKLATKAADWPRFDESKVKSMLSSYQNLKANDFAKNDADTGLSDPIENGGIVRIKLKDDTASYALKVGKTQEGTSRYLVKEGGDGTVFVISSWTADWATGDAEKFSKPEEKKKDEADKAGGEDDDLGEDLGDDLGDDAPAKKGDAKKGDAKKPPAKAAPAKAPAAKAPAAKAPAAKAPPAK